MLQLVQEKYTLKILLKNEFGILVKIIMVDFLIGSKILKFSHVKFRSYYRHKNMTCYYKFHFLNQFMFIL